MATDFGRHAYCVALKYRIFTGFSYRQCDCSQCVPPRHRHVSRKFPRAVMSDEMQQGSAPAFRSGVTGNCGKPRARISCAPLSERAGRDPTSRNICGVSVASAMSVAAGVMGSQEVALATVGQRSRDPRLPQFATGAPARPAPPGGVCRNDCDHGPGRPRPIGQGYYLNWLPQPRRFAYALR
jgi:hypothetical protein